jgi:hypothetical protein
VSGGGGFTVTVSVWVVLAPTESAHFTVMLAVAAAVGVPLIVTEPDVLEPSDKPLGKVPELRLQVKGPVPPLALIVVEYPVPAVAAVREVVVITGARLTVICALADCEGLVTDVAVTVAICALLTLAGAL